MYSQSQEYYVNSRSEMLPFVPTSAKKILDVGCGQGDFAMLLKDKLKAEVWGADLNAESIKIAHNRLDKAIAGDFAQLLHELPDGYFDAICFNDVLEHFVDPYSVLSCVRSKLTVGGVVVSSIPNVRYFRNLINLLYKKDWRYEDYGVMDRTHLRFFTEKSIRDMYDACGYSIVSMQGIGKTRSVRPILYNLVTFGGFSADTHFLQFATVARPIS